MENRQQKRYQLRHDLNSYFKPSHAYAKQGDYVTLIADHGEVWIIEGVGGGRFPVHIRTLMDDNGQPLSPGDVNNLQLLEAVVTGYTTKNKKKTKIVSAVKPPTLF